MRSPTKTVSSLSQYPLATKANEAVSLVRCFLCAVLETADRLECYPFNQQQTSRRRVEPDVLACVRPCQVTSTDHVEWATYWATY